MKNTLLFLLFTACIFASCSKQEEPSSGPLKTTQAFFESLTFPESKSSVCCDMLDSGYYSVGAFTFFKKYSKEYQEVFNNDTNAVVSIMMKDSSEFDAYLYLLNEKGSWKVEGVTGMWKPFLLSQMGNIFIVPDTSKAKMIQQGKWDEFSRWQERLNLVTGSDKDIIKYFNDNKKSFISLLPSADSLHAPDFPGPADAYDSLSQVKPWLPKLNLNLVYNEAIPYFDFPYLGVKFFEIANVFGKTAGYLYTTDKTKLPRMSKERFIVIKEIGDGWYMYKAEVGNKQ